MLGQGASGLVQKAFWPAKAEFVAVKKISVLEREKRHQLMNDIKALCNTPDVAGLIRFYGAYHCADKGQIAVALEYMDGGSLADVLERVGKIPEKVLACITKQVLLGLAYLHANHTVHRDIKPANILMSIRGEPKVSDFGISAFVDNTVAQCHTFLGTVTYMSPERINGQPYSFPADIWSLGLTLLECVTGRYPYDASGGTIELMIQILEEDCPFPTKDGDGDELSPNLVDFVSRCLNKDPMKRPTAEELLKHPWVASMESEAVDLRRFMRCMYNSEEKIGDAVAICSARLYNTISNNWMDPDSIAAFYSPESMLTESTTSMVADSVPKYATPASQPIGFKKFKGRYTIAEHIQSIAAAASSRCATFEILSTKHKQEKSEVRGDVVLQLDKRASPSKKKKNVADEGLVTIVHKIALRREDATVRTTSRPLLQPHHQSQTIGINKTEVVGMYEETLVIRLRDVTALVPGIGFSIRSHDIRWTQPLVGVGRHSHSHSYSHSHGGGIHLKHAASPPTSCRQQ